ncbi:MAG: hypothetical protein M3Y86_07855 [Verrucomicrobiota bacterium]|nr:hypothetical protein [Verrucomicrobiota bacterium]
MRFSKLARLTSGLALVASLAGAVPSAFAHKAAPALAPTPEPMASAPPAPPGKLNVLILGDSLALCGFGKRLDARFRSDPQVSAVFTYMTCGTNPLSWLEQKPYTNVKTPCGYWSIESLGEGKGPREFEDVYGMQAGHIPKPRTVPKLEEMLADLNPDVLIIQTGSNLFGLFPDAKTVKPGHHVNELKKYLLPFKSKLLEPPSNLKKVYWVNPPTSGRVATTVQDFLFQQARAELGPEVEVIDSRQLVSYPYQHMEPDKEHFIGAQMDEWADKVFAIVQKDLAAQPIASLRPISQPNVARAEPVIPKAEPVIARAEPVIPRAEPAEQPPVAAPVATPPLAPVRKKKDEPLIVKATLVFKSNPMQLDELLPYQESLVAYVYNIDKVVRGQYSERQILVMHPAFIALKPQRLDKFRLGKRYKLRLHLLEGTLWSTAKMRDETGQINLTPYIGVEDLKQYPNHR